MRRICHRRTPRRCRCRAARSDVDDPWYLPRPTDATALSVARQPGQTMTIKGPRQMGKSSLLMRTIKAALDVGKKVALLDFQLVDEASKADATCSSGGLPPRSPSSSSCPTRSTSSGTRAIRIRRTAALRRAANPAADRCAVHDRDRRNRLDLPHHVLRTTSSRCCEAGTDCARIRGRKLEEPRHRAVDLDRAAVLHRSSARVAVQRRRQCCRSRTSRSSRSGCSTPNIRGRSVTRTSARCTD